MKHALAIPVLLLIATSASADDGLIRLDDPALWLDSALGKQVSVRFSDGFARDHLPGTDYEAVIISGLPDGKICLFGRDPAFDPANERLKDVVRGEGGDICVPRSEISIRTASSSATGEAPMPFYSTDAKNCVWSWKSGGGLGLWTEDCTFETGRWDVAFDEGSASFALRVDGGDPYPVVRHFKLEAGQGIEALLPSLKAKGLVLDDPECVFEPSPDMGAPYTAPSGWSLWQVMPVGERKKAFDSQPADEVPEPPCGELGYVVDHVGYFAVNSAHPDRPLYFNLGQDGTLIDPYSIVFK